MKSWFEKILMPSLIGVIIVGLIASIVFLFIKNNEEISEQEKNNLHIKEQQLTEDFTNLSTIDGVETKTSEGKIIATFYGENCKLEAIYNQDYEFISKAIIDTRIYTNIAGMVLVILVGGLLLPCSAWLLIMFLLAIIHDIVVAIVSKKREREKKYEQR